MNNWNTAHKICECRDATHSYNALRIRSHYDAAKKAQIYQVQFVIGPSCDVCGEPWRRLTGTTGPVVKLA